MGFAIRMPILKGWNQKQNITTKITKEHKDVLYKVLLELRVLRGVYYRL